MNGLSENFKTVESVECGQCGDTHLRSGNNYITVYGNICVGEHGGIVGNGNWDDFGIPVAIMCRECFVEFIEREAQ